MPIERYRPSLTAEQITAICNLCRANPSGDSIDILRTLIPFEAKIREGIKSPVSSVETLDEKLGWPSAKTTLQSPATKRLLAYQKWQANVQECTVEELELARDHRYLAGLMTPLESVEYENEMNQKSELPNG
jgi:hypothetical protein